MTVFLAFISPWHRKLPSTNARTIGTISAGVCCLSAMAGRGSVTIILAIGFEIERWVTARLESTSRPPIEWRCYLLRLLTAAFGTFRTWRDVRPESAFGGKAENIYSERVFQLLTHRRSATTTAASLLAAKRATRATSSSSPPPVASRGIKAPAFGQRDQIAVDASELVMAS